MGQLDHSMNSITSQYAGESAVIMRAQMQLAACGHPAILVNSREGCLADAALMVANSGNVAKPLQIKTTSVEPKAAAGKNKQFKLQKTNKYPGCLVVCCAFLR